MTRKNHLVGSRRTRNSSTLQELLLDSLYQSMYNTVRPSYYIAPGTKKNVFYACSFCIEGTLFFLQTRSKALSFFTVVVCLSKLCSAEKHTNPYQKRHFALITFSKKGTKNFPYCPTKTGEDLLVLIRKYSALNKIDKETAKTSLDIRLSETHAHVVEVLLQTRSLCS